MERTFLMIKPSAVAQGLVGEILSAVERAGLRVVTVASRTLTPDEARGIYDVHADKPFFEPHIHFVTSGISVGVILEAPDAVGRLRAIVGATDPAEAHPGTLRASYGRSIRENAVHAADSPERFVHESAIYFGDGSGVETA